MDINTPYATVDDVIRRYTPITTMIGVNTTDVTTVDIASVYIADGQSIVNGYLSRRYVLPLTPEPILTDLCSDIAIYRIIRDKQARIPEFMATRYTDAMSLLTMLRDGGMDLTGSNPVNSGGGDEFAWSNVLDTDFKGTIFSPAETWPQSPCIPFNRFG